MLREISSYVTLRPDTEHFLMPTENLKPFENRLDLNGPMRGMGFEPKNSYETRPST